MHASLQHPPCMSPNLATRCAIASRACQHQYAVVGGGIAGLATTWHLLQHLQDGSALHLYEAHDLGAGGSGAAAGLLHPYNPKGRLLWHGREAMDHALQLVDAAQAAAHTDDRLPAAEATLAWRTGIARVASNPKQRTALDAAAATQPAVAALTTAALQTAVPGAVPGESTTEAATAALLLRDAVVLHPHRYMRALWLASMQLAAARGVDLQMVRARVPSLASLRETPWHAVVVAAGAAVATLPELADVLPLELCQGVTLHMAPPAEAPQHSYPEGAPSLLSQPYLAAHGPGQVVVGATKQYGTSAAASWEACAAGSLPWSHPEAQAAASVLLGPAAALWGPLSHWRVTHARLGVRALPPRTAEGAMPLAGRVPGMDNVWVVAGLGARGLVYHAWLGKLVAEGVVRGSDQLLPQQLRRWQ